MKKTSKVLRIAAMGISVNACHFWFAQPKVPQGLDKFRSEK